MIWCSGCGHSMQPEDGRRIDDEPICLPCFRRNEARRARQEARRGPRRVVDQETRRTLYGGLLDGPQANPGAWLAHHSLAHPWTVWAMNRGLLEEWFEREITVDDFGDDESIALAKSLEPHLRIEL